VIVMRPLIKPGTGVDRSELAFFLNWRLCQRPGCSCDGGGSVEWLVIQSGRP
jgi:hypothetical protein